MSRTRIALLFCLGLAALAITPASLLSQDTEIAKPDPEKTAQRIDVILYSDMSKDAMLARLKPFVAVMDTTTAFKKKTGLDLGNGVGSGPGVMHYKLTNCGLQLVVDPDERIRIIRRSKKRVGDKEYPQMSVSASSFEWQGYSRFYPD